MQLLKCFLHSSSLGCPPASSRECETIKNSGYSTTELRKDIEEMENEKEIVQKRIERMQRKVVQLEYGRR